VTVHSSQWQKAECLLEVYNTLLSERPKMLNLLSSSCLLCRVQPIIMNVNARKVYCAGLGGRRTRESPQEEGGGRVREGGGMRKSNLSGHRWSR
jgi:hypothetical protein